jgi:hypothetical protein
VPNQGCLVREISSKKHNVLILLFKNYAIKYDLRMINYIKGLN